MFDEVMDFGEGRVIERVDEVTGKLYKVKEASPKELRDLLKAAPRRAGSEPIMVGVRLRGLTGEQIVEVRKTVAATEIRKLITQV